jgi:hypothetical protein
MKRTARRNNLSSELVSKRRLPIARETIKELSSDGLLKAASGCPYDSTTTSTDAGG